MRDTLHLLCRSIHHSSRSSACAERRAPHAAGAVQAGARRVPRNGRAEGDEAKLSTHTTPSRVREEAPRCRRRSTQTRTATHFRGPPAVFWPNFAEARLCELPPTRPCSRHSAAQQLPAAHAPAPAKDGADLLSGRAQSRRAGPEPAVRSRRLPPLWAATSRGLRSSLLIFRRGFYWAGTAQLHGPTAQPAAPRIEICCRHSRLTSWTVPGLATCSASGAHQVKAIELGYCGASTASHGEGPPRRAMSRNHPCMVAHAHVPLADSDDEPPRRQLPSEKNVKPSDTLCSERNIRK